MTVYVFSCNSTAVYMRMFFLSPLVVDYYEEVVRSYPVYFYDRHSVK